MVFVALMNDSAIRLLLTRHVHVNYGAQQSHVIVIVHNLKARVVEDLQCPVVLPQRVVCNAYSACHNRPVSYLKHVITAEE